MPDEFLSNSHKQDLIQQFIDRTSSSNAGELSARNKAKFHLESAQWNLELAIDNYISTNKNQHGKSGPVPQGSSSTGNRQGISTFNDINTDSSGNDGKQTYFTGGDKSGMLVEDPNKPQNDHEGLVESIINKARQAGRNMPQDGQKFTGTGRSLNSDSVDEEEQVVECNMTFWKDGFSIEDGPLMKYDDPANEQVLELIYQGQAPLHLFNVKPGQRADVKVSHRTSENYVPPKKVVKPFEGTGQRLGAHVPSESVGSSSQHVPPSNVTSSFGATSGGITVDVTKPVTSIQIRLADGTRLVSKFNLTHTVADIRNFINNSRSGESQRAYTLGTQFPVATLQDDQTIEDANLKNAVVLQKYV